jgi:predicted phage-related endonuclease
MSDRPNIPVPDELAAIREQIRRLEDRELELKRLLIANEDLRTGADWIAEINTVQTTRTDWKELKAMYPEIIAEQTFPSSYTVVSLKVVTEDGEIVSARRFKKEATP